MDSRRGWGCLIDALTMTDKIHTRGPRILVSHFFAEERSIDRVLGWGSINPWGSPITSKSLILPFDPLLISKSNFSIMSSGFAIFLLWQCEFQTGLWAFISPKITLSHMISSNTLRLRGVFPSHVQPCPTRLSYALTTLVRLAGLFNRLSISRMSSARK